MPSREDLTDALIALIPEDGSRISNGEIKAQLERQLGEAIADQALEEAKTQVVAMGAAQPQITLEGISSVDLVTCPLPLRSRFQQAVTPMFEQAWGRSRAKSQTSAKPATCSSPACSPARSMWRRCRSRG
jgi:hypothetical protein